MNNDGRPWRAYIQPEPSEGLTRTWPSIASGCSASHCIASLSASDTYIVPRLASIVDRASSPVAHAIGTSATDAVAAATIAVVVRRRRMAAPPCGGEAGTSSSEEPGPPERPRRTTRATTSTSHATATPMHTTRRMPMGAWIR